MKIITFTYDDYFDLTANCYLLINDSKECIAIDFGKEDEQVVNYIKENNLKLEAVLLTHGHFDHIKGVDYLLNNFSVPVYIHEPDKEFFLEFKPVLKSFPTTIIILITKTPILNCSNTNTIKKDLQILFFSTEGNDDSVIPHIQNCIRNTFASLLISYKETLNTEKASILGSSIQYQSKIGDLIDLMNENQKTYGLY